MNLHTMNLTRPHHPIFKNSLLVTLLLFVLTFCASSFQAVTSAATLADTNAVPYISTYYIQPKVNSGHNVVIEYYVTDYEHKEYLKDNNSETFTIEYWVNGAKSTLSNVKAGDNTLTIKPLAKGEVLFALQATDKAGRKSHRLYQEFLIVDPQDSVIPKDKILTPDLKKFGIYNDDTHPVETTKGLTEMLKWAGDNGYRKVVLPKGRYRLDENSTVQMASNLTLDMNGSTFKLNRNALDKVMMFEMYKCVDSHVINGTFEGDLKEHDFKNAPNNSEWVCAINMGQDTKYSSFRDIKIIDVTGYGSNTGFGGGGTRTYSQVSPKSAGKYVPGDIDAQGNLVPSEVRTTNDKPIDIAPFLEVHGFLQLGPYLGYQGNPAGNWVYKASFYDADNKFIESIEGYLYRRLYPPKNAKFARFTLLSTATPTNLSLYNFRTPYNCAFINVHHENIRCVGMVPSGFNNLLVEGNTFENCGWASARCAFDAEDGWDMMQDLTFRNNTFGKNPANEFLTCAGHNFVMENNSMKVYMWDRTRSAVFRNNKIKSASFLYGTRLRSGYSRISNNVIEGGVSLRTQTATPTGDFVIRDNQINGDVSSVAEAKSKALAAYFYKCKINGGTLNAKAVKCDINDVKNAGGTYEIVDSKVENSYLKTSGYGLQSRIAGSTVKNSQIITMGGTMRLENNVMSETDCTAIQDWSDGHEYILLNNRIETSRDHLIYVGNSYKQIELRGNTINSSNPKFSVVLLNNPTKDSLVNQRIRLVDNTFNGKGGTVLNVARVPNAAATLVVEVYNNVYNEIKEFSANIAGAANIKINTARPDDKAPAPA